MRGMRINLVTPFAEKDAVKALGARWDPAKRVWYITDVADLSPFERWIPDLNAAISGATAEPAGRPNNRNPPATGSSARPVARKPVAMDVAHCGCPVLPWEPCVHSPSSNPT